MKHNKLSETQLAPIENTFHTNMAALLKEDLSGESQKWVSNNLNVNMNELASVAYRTIENDISLSDTEVAISLLHHLSDNSKSKYVRKLAKSMIKREWWKNR